MSALEDNSTGGIPNTEQRGGESTPEQIHQEGAQHVKEATQANQANQSGVGSGTAADQGTVPSALGSTTNSRSHTDRSAMEDPVSHKSQPADADEKDAHKPPKPADKKGGKQENPSAIPSAGGERLGEKHWGESEIVPDLPKKRASDAGQSGVSSDAGQPTSEVADNTAANTGGATSGPHDGNDSAEKHGAMDKIKEKLHIGQK